MKKVKMFLVLTVVFSMIMGTTVFAANSPVTGVVTSSTGYAVSIREVESKAVVAALANMISAQAAANGCVPNVKLCKDVIKPAGYVNGSPITLTWTVAGLADGATNVFAYHYKEDGTIEVVPCSVRGGKVTFTLTSLSPVAIVEFNAGAAPAAKAGGLHQTGEGMMLELLVALAAIAGTVLVYNRKRA